MDETKPSDNVVPISQRLLIADNLTTEEEINAFLDQMARKIFADVLQRHPRQR